jgi:tetratricopeptide (TPR) repeat protein
LFDHTEGARHLPFFVELASLEDSDANWRSVSAGLVVLRLVDSWVEEGAGALVSDGWGMRSVVAAIDEMPAGVPTRALLHRVVEALKVSSASDLHAIAPRLIAYARALHIDSRWALAADVYETVIAHVHPIEESDVAITAHLRLAACQRSLGALDEAARSLDAATVVATKVDDLVGMLHAQIGTAKIALDRGNMPRAEEILDDAIARATQSEALMEVRAVALQDRANVAFHRARYDLAVELAYQSLELTTDSINRDRLLADIASAFYMLGVHTAAKDAYQILEATAQEQYNRWYASINLMEIAAREGSMPLFERYRRVLAATAFPPVLEAQFHLQTAESYEALSQFDAARSAAERARAIAERYGFNHTMFAAEAVVARVTSGQPVVLSLQEISVPSSLREIATTIGELRRKVPAGPR